MYLLSLLHHEGTYSVTSEVSGYIREWGVGGEEEKQIRVRIEQRHTGVRVRKEQKRVRIRQKQTRMRETDTSKK